MKRLYLLEFCLLILLGHSELVYAQIHTTWRPLPSVSGLKAHVWSKPVHTQKIKIAKDHSKVSEKYLDQKLEFSAYLSKKILTPIFKVYEVKWDLKTPLPDGLIFKDIATSNIRYLDKGHGLPGKGISALAQGLTGEIYLGFDNGIIRYNGSEFSVLTGIPSLPLTGIRSLFMDSEGRLWIATDKDICYVKENRIYIPEKNIFGTTHLKGFNENKESGEVLIFTRFHGLFILKNGTYTQYLEGLQEPNVSSAIKSSDGTLWMTSQGVGFVRNDSLFKYPFYGNYNTITSLYEDNGEIWIGTFIGKLLKFRNDSLFQVDLGEDTHRIYSIEKNNKGIWLSDYGRGVYLIRPTGQIDFFGTENGLVGPTAYCLMIDNYDNIWVADPYKGVSRIDENIFYQSKIPINRGIVTDIEIDSKGKTWYFISSGHVICQDSLEFTEYISNGNYCESGVIIDGVTWMSNADHGLTQLGSDHFLFYTMKDDVGADSTIYNIQEDAAGNIWGWNYGNRLYRFKDGIFYNYNEHWKELRFIKVVGTPNKTVFALTDNTGVMVIRNGNYTHLTEETGLISNRISFVFEDSEGVFWFCADGKIQRNDFNGKNFINNSSYFINNPIIDILEIDRDQFLAVTNDGIISIKKNNEVLEYRFFGKEYGLRVIGNSLVKRNGNGEIVIGGQDRLMTFDSYFLNQNKLPARLSLDRITIGDSIISSQNSSISVAQSIPLRFIFNNIDWGGNSSIRYQLNYEDRVGQWNEISGNTILLQELPYGGYELLASSAEESRTSNIVSVSFKVKPYWYQTWLFRILTGILIIVILVLFLVYRERKSKADRLRLEKLVRERTYDVSLQLAQKEILMQEVHHRVKNNLTFLKGLLYLRARASTDQKVKQILDECQARIQSMALVHQNLYDVNNTSEVDFENFLTQLFYQLETMFDLDNRTVSLNIQSDNLKIDMRMSIFIGLILNELITNTFKYSLTDGYVAVHVTIFQTLSGYELSYSDSGKGLPDGFDYKMSKGFGFKMIGILLNQLNANMTYDKGKFCTFNITIPK